MNPMCFIPIVSSPTENRDFEDIFMENFQEFFCRSYYFFQKILKVHFQILNINFFKINNSSTWVVTRIHILKYIFFPTVVRLKIERGWSPPLFSASCCIENIFCNLHFDCQVHISVAQTPEKNTSDHPYSPMNPQQTTVIKLIQKPLKQLNYNRFQYYSNPLLKVINSHCLRMT